MAAESVKQQGLATMAYWGSWEHSAGVGTYSSYNGEIRQRRVILSEAVTVVVSQDGEDGERRPVNRSARLVTVAGNFSVVNSVGLTIGIAVTLRGALGLSGGACMR